MQHLELVALAKSQRWKELEQAWLAAIEDAAGDVPVEDFLVPIELSVKAGQNGLAETLAWAWLSAVKERAAPDESLRLARELLVRLPSGDDLRTEVLDLYRKTHADAPDLERWIERSGFGGGKSVKRALRYLDVGLKLRAGIYLLNRSDDETAELTAANLAIDEFTVRRPHQTATLTAEQVLESYDPVDADDFRVLSQWRPDRIGVLANSDPESLLIGIARGRQNQIDRDELKLLLAPRFVPHDQWIAWWNKARDAIKKSKHLRVEGRSPMLIIYTPGGLSAEDETWSAFEKADSPRQWLEIIEGYLRATRGRKAVRDTVFLEKIQTALVRRAEKFAKHEPIQAFAAALINERLAGEGLPEHPEAHGLALRMIKESKRPATLVLDLPDAALWSLGIAALRQALPDQWPDIFAELMRSAPMSQLDALGKAVEEAGRAELIPPIVERALVEPAAYVDLLMWVWRTPAIKTPLTLPPRTELFSRVLALVGPARERTGASGGPEVTTMRGKVRSGLGSRGYAEFRAMLESLDDTMAAPLRRQIERADGLGPVVQDEMLGLLRERYPALYLRAKVAPWEEQGVLYVTNRGLKAKEAELSDLVNVKMRENAKAIGAAAEHGDLSENSEYKFALEERDLLRARLAKINHELSMSREMSVNELPDDHISIGHRVHLASEDGSDPAIVTILGPWESDLAKHIFSYQTPLAKRLLGKHAGDSVEISLDEQTRRFRIESFEPAPELSLGPALAPSKMPGVPV